MEIERGLPSLLQMSPRGILLGSVPVLSERRFAEKRGFDQLGARLIFENRDKRAARRRQVNNFEQSNGSLLVDYCFK